MSTFTAGPWQLDENVIHVGDTTLATVAGGTSLYCPPMDEAKANAHLIAAAPDLLAVCEEFVRKVEAGEARSQRSYTQMRAAVEKARGEA